VSVVRLLSGKQFNGYLRVKLPHELDRTVESVVDAYQQGSQAVRRQMLDEVTPRAAGVLSAYGERMAAAAVRTKSEEALRRGLVAMGMAEMALDDRRNNLIVLAAVNHSATILGREFGDILLSVASDLPDDVLASFREFNERKPEDKSLRSMGLGVEGSSDTFRYVSH
jgi:hypothetical protein